MLRNELKTIADGLIETVKGFVDKATATLNGRIDSLEKALRELPMPKDGTSVTLEDVKPLVEELVKAIPAPAAGRDADPAVIAEQVAKAVAELPKPADGKSVTLEDLKPLVEEAVKALPVPAPGRDADPAVIVEQVAKAVAELPKPADGKSVTIEDVKPLIEATVADAVKSLPLPKDGTSVSVADVEPMLQELVGKAVAEIPAPQAGKDSSAAEVAILVLPELKEMLQSLPKPADGKSVTVEDVAPLFELAFSKWALDFERRAADTLQRAAERIPVPKDGLDGMSIEDLAVEHDGEGGVTLKFARGELSREFKLQLPRFKDCGVFREGRYTKGDGVTWGGSFFIAQKDGPAGKPGESDDWRLAVKRGRDGRDAIVKTVEPAGAVRLGT